MLAAARTDLQRFVFSPLCATHGAIQVMKATNGKARKYVP
jgi:hypothetical protein